MNVRKYCDKGTTNWHEEIILTRKEQAVWYNECINRILNNTREVLDSLDFSESFQVNWNNYGTRYMKYKCIKCGKEFKKQPKECKCGNVLFNLIHYGVGLPPSKTKSL